MNWDELSKYKRHILKDYLEEMTPVRNMEGVSFDSKRACSACGEAGYVPTHHRFLCVFCWCIYQTKEPFGGSMVEDGWVQGDKSRMPIPIQGIVQDEGVIYTVTYNAKNCTQADLQSLVDECR